MADAPEAAGRERAPRRVMWAAALMTRPLRERVAAVASSGFDAMSVFPADMARWRGEGLSDATIASIIADAGVAVATVDPFATWTPGWTNGGLDDFTRDFIDFSEDAVFTMAEALGCEQVNLVESAGQPYDRARYAEAMAAVVDRATRRGLRLTFEFMPTSQIPDLAEGWALVQAAGGHIGLTFDTWHFWRSDPDHDLLASLPPGTLVEVQVADGGTQVVGDLQNDLLHHRRVPGTGDFDLGLTIGVLSDLGALASVGPETFSDEMNALTSAEAVGRNEAALTMVLTAAGAAETKEDTR